MTRWVAATQGVLREPTSDGVRRLGAGGHDQCNPGLAEATARLPAMASEIGVRMVITRL